MARYASSSLVVLGLIAIAACGSEEGAPASVPGPDAAIEAGTDAPPSGADGAVDAGDGAAPLPTAGDLARAAILLASCHGGSGPFGDLAASGQEPSELLYFMQTVLVDEPRNAKVRAELACLGAKTNGCKAIEECMGTTIDQEPCNALTCNGDVLERCVSSRRLRIDCARLEQRCEPGVGCIDKNASPCGGGFTETCTDGRVVSCRKGFLVQGPKCDQFVQLSCGVTAPGGTPQASCTGVGAACTGGVKQSGEVIAIDAYFTNAARCESGSLVTCFAGKEAKLACNTLVAGHTCQTASFDGRNLSYCGRGTACVPGEPRSQLGGRPTCDGDDYVICNGGIHERISCKALGFATCNGERCRP